MTDHQTSVTSSSPATDRRNGTFAPLIATALTVALAATAIIAAGGPARAESATRMTSVADGASTVNHEAWLDALQGKHRMLFDAAVTNGGIPLVHVMNFYDTYNKAYGASDRDVNAVFTFYGATTFFGLNDAMWAKYALGDFSGTNDPASGKPATTNLWRSAPQILGMSFPQASVESLQKRGATFIVCDNALGVFALLVAQKRGLDAATVLADFNANILPGVTRVPAMVIAIEKAQARGLSYHRQ